MATAPLAAPRSPSPRRRWLRRAPLLVMTPYLGVVLLLTIFQRSLIFIPTRVESIPASLASSASADAQSVTVRTDDGLDLNGWWLTSRDASASPRREWTRGKPLVLYFCGNAGHRGYRLEEFDILTEWGADVLCCDYRGYGDNSGSPSEEGLAVDARAVWRFATQERAIPASRIVIFGESLGGGVAVRLAAEMCAAGTPPAGLLTRCTFSSLTDVAADDFPWIPVRWLMFDRFPSAERIARVTSPMLLIHGQRDTIVPYDLGRRLFDAAPERSAGGVLKRFVDLPTADHNDVLLMEGTKFREAIADFLDELFPRRPAGSEQATTKTANKAKGSMLGPLERSLIYHPERAPDLAPAEVGLPVDRVHPIVLTTDDGLSLNGWHILGSGRTAADRAGCDRELSNGRPLVLFFSGNGGNRAWRISECEVFTDAGADVFIFDYRGYGENQGNPSERLIAADARAMWGYATRERRVARSRVVLYGESLGGGVAIRLAQELCAEGAPPAGLIVRSTFTSLPDVARIHYPWLPTRLIMAERYDSLTKIADVTCPILVLHGIHDTIVPFDQGRRLFAAAPQQSADGIPKQFVELPNSDHNDVLENDGGRIREAIGKFLSLIPRAATE